MQMFVFVAESGILNLETNIRTIINTYGTLT